VALVRRWLRLDPETQELRLVTIDLFDGRHDRWEWRCVGDDGRPLRGHRWQDFDGRRAEYAAHVGRSYLNGGAFGEATIWLDTEPRPVVERRTDCRLFDRNGERIVRNRNRVCPVCRAVEAEWEATA
jgi:hypothetical protein